MKKHSELAWRRQRAASRQIQDLWDAWCVTADEHAEEDILDLFFAQKRWPSKTQLISSPHAGRDWQVERFLGTADLRTYFVPSENGEDFEQVIEPFEGEVLSIAPPSEFEALKRMMLAKFNAHATYEEYVAAQYRIARGLVCGARANAALQHFPESFTTGGTITWRACRECGCTQTQACVDERGPCWWVEDDLCSHCAGPAATPCPPVLGARVGMGGRR